MVVCSLLLLGHPTATWCAFSGQYLRQDPDAADVQVLTKACIWGNNLYNAGKGKVLEQARTAAYSSLHLSTHINAKCAHITLHHSVSEGIISSRWNQTYNSFRSSRACQQYIASAAALLTSWRSSAQEYIDVSRKRLGRQSLDLLQFYWHDYSIKNYVDAALRLTDMQACKCCSPRKAAYLCDMHVTALRRICALPYAVTA